MSSTISCGVIIYKKRPNRKDKILIGHVTNQSHWDIPKGGMDEGEEPIDTAIRELQEETGFVVSKDELVDLGEHQYKNSKRLHLFLYSGTEYFQSSLGNCSTYFRCPKSGREFPEIDDYKYVPVDGLEKYLTPRMVNLLKGIDIAK